MEICGVGVVQLCLTIFYLIISPEVWHPLDRKGTQSFLVQPTVVVWRTGGPSRFWRRSRPIPLQSVLWSVSMKGIVVNNDSLNEGRSEGIVFYRCDCIHKRQGKWAGFVFPSTILRRALFCIIQNGQSLACRFVVVLFFRLNKGLDWITTLRVQGIENSILPDLAEDWAGSIL